MLAVGKHASLSYVYTLLHRSLHVSHSCLPALGRRNNHLHPNAVGSKRAGCAARKLRRPRVDPEPSKHIPADNTRTAAFLLASPAPPWLSQAAEKLTHEASLLARRRGEGGAYPDVLDGVQGHVVRRLLAIERVPQMRHGKHAFSHPCCRVASCLFVKSFLPSAGRGSFLFLPKEATFRYGVVPFLPVWYKLLATRGVDTDKSWRGELLF